MPHSYALGLMVLLAGLAQARDPVLPPLSAPIYSPSAVAPPVRLHTPAPPPQAAVPPAAPLAGGPGGCAPMAAPVMGAPVGACGPACGVACARDQRSLCQRVCAWLRYKPTKACCHCCVRPAREHPFFTVYDYFCEGCVAGAGCGSPCGPLTPMRGMFCSGHRMMGMQAGHACPTCR